MPRKNGKKERTLVNSRKRLLEHLQGLPYIKDAKYRRAYRAAKLAIKVFPTCMACPAVLRDDNIKPRNNKRCCRSCVENLGHFGYDVLIYKPKKYLKYWSSITGFWRTGKGCILPREMRSQTCLKYHCEEYFDENGECSAVHKRIDDYYELIELVSGYLKQKAQEQVG